MSYNFATGAFAEVWKPDRIETPAEATARERAAWTPEQWAQWLAQQHIDRRFALDFLRLGGPAEGGVVLA